MNYCRTFNNKIVVKCLIDDIFRNIANSIAFYVLHFLSKLIINNYV